MGKSLNVARAEYKRIAEHEWPTEPKRRKVVMPSPVPTKVHRHYHAPAKTRVPTQKQEQETKLVDDGTYIVVWASVLRDLTALFFEGVGLVLLGHVVSVAAIMMLAGVGLGLFSIRMKTKHIQRRKK